MITTLIPASIIGKVFIVGPYLFPSYAHMMRIPLNGGDAVIPASGVQKIHCALSKVQLTKNKKYWECRIVHYRPETGEMSLRLDSSTNNDKWFELWYSANREWVQELKLKYIFID